MKVTHSWKFNCQACLGKKAKVEKVNEVSETNETDKEPKEPIVVDEIEDKDDDISTDTGSGLVRPYLVRELEIEDEKDPQVVLEISNPTGLEYWGTGVWKQNGIKYRIVVHLLDGEVPIELWEAMPQIGRTNLGKKGLSVEGTKAQKERENIQPEDEP